LFFQNGFLTEAVFLWVNPACWWGWLYQLREQRALISSSGKRKPIHLVDNAGAATIYGLAVKTQNNDEPASEQAEENRIVTMPLEL
jgi:hypothetical protein